MLYSHRAVRRSSWRKSSEYASTSAEKMRLLVLPLVPPLPLASRLLLHGRPSGRQIAPPTVRPVAGLGCVSMNELWWVGVSRPSFCLSRLRSISESRRERRGVQLTCPH